MLQKIIFKQKDGKGEIPMIVDANVADRINRDPAEGVLAVKDMRTGVTRTINRATHPTVEFGDLEPE